jgi:hypothetical protein
MTADRSRVHLLFHSISCRGFRWLQWFQWLQWLQRLQWPVVRLQLDWRVAQSANRCFIVSVNNKKRMPAFAARARERKIKINLRIQFRSADF